VRADCTIPHLHVHVYPRYAGDPDPFEGVPIDARSASVERSPELLARLRAALSRLSAVSRRA